MSQLIQISLRNFFGSSVKAQKECFCAALYTCYAHISPDVALELGWIHGYHNFIMPFLIQTFKTTHVRLKELETKTNPKEEETKTEDEIAGTYGTLNGFNGPLMLENGGMGMTAPVPMNGGIDMSGFAAAGGVQVQPNVMPQMNMGM